MDESRRGGAGQPHTEPSASRVHLHPAPGDVSPRCAALTLELPARRLELRAGYVPHLPRYAAGVVTGHRCPDDQLCDACCAHQLRATSPQADAIGQCWAERVCRGELRARPAWPEHALAAVCSAGAAAWWQRRPAAYRIEDATAPSTWSLVTSPDERERCCVVVGGERCPDATTFQIAAGDGALDDYTYTCAGHVELVAGPGTR